MFAFEELSAALEAIGEPALAERCRAAANDERRHREAMAALAAARGATPARATSAPSRWANLEALVRENVVHGCVEELWSAALATYAAIFAADRTTRPTLLTIAREEAGHARLALDIHAALVRRLDPHARARIAHAHRAATAALVGRRAPSANDPIVLAGLAPAPAVRGRMLNALFRAPSRTASRSLAFGGPA